VKTLLNIFTCCLFGLILVSPVVLTVTDVELTKPLEENRAMEVFPGMANCEFGQMDDCFKKINTWFDDNYRPRDLLTKLQTQIDYSVFSTSDKVHIGSDDWLFYRSIMDTQKVLSERSPRPVFDQFLASLGALDHYLQTRDIQLIVLPIPLKDTIYPEKLPSSTPNLPENSRYQQLRQWLAAHESIITIDAYDHLIQRKAIARSFHKTDFHWNDPAGFLFAEKLVNRLWELQSGESTPLWEQELTVEEREFSGGQANFLPLLAAPQEQGLFLDVTWERAKGTHSYNNKSEFWNYTYDGTGDERGRLDGVVVMGDSFFDAMHRSGVDSYFSSVHRSSVQPDRFGEVYARIPDGTRYFILQLIESSLIFYSNAGLEVPDI